MTTPDANGWLDITTTPPPDETRRVMYYYPKVAGFDAFVSIQSSFISDHQWRKPTHWQPEPKGPQPHDPGKQEDMFV